MPQALFVCWLCQQSFPAPKVHFCQKECHKASGIHHDFCPNCKSICLASWSGERMENGELHGED
jgi:hypothetical protein